MILLNLRDALTRAVLGDRGSILVSDTDFPVLAYSKSL